MLVVFTEHDELFVNTSEHRFYRQPEAARVYFPYIIAETNDSDGDGDGDGDYEKAALRFYRAAFYCLKLALQTNQNLYEIPA